jgi:hypothetical protein
MSQESPHESVSGGISENIVYQSIREEILDQKKCQFQIFSVAVAITSVVLAYALRDGELEFALIAPIVMNTLALVIIVDKAISIQRKVGYLQMIEGGMQKLKIDSWKWETHLDYSFTHDPRVAPIE